MNGRGYLRTKWAWGVVALLGSTTPAWGFYFLGWPGSQVTPRPSLLAPTVQGSPNVPVNTTPGPLPNPDGPSNPPNQPPTSTPIQTPPLNGGSGVPPSPQHLPEPATGFIAAIGLGVVAFSRQLRKRILSRRAS